MSDKTAEETLMQLKKLAVLCESVIEENQKLHEENKELNEKLSTASGYCADFFNCMTESQMQTLDMMSMQFWDGEPASHKDIVCYLSDLLRNADDFEEENEKLKAKLEGNK